MSGYGYYDKWELVWAPDKRDVPEAPNHVYQEAANELRRVIGGKCGNIAAEALLSTGWERHAKITDIADTVYNITESKILCGKEIAKEAAMWIDANLYNLIKGDYGSTVAGDIYAPDPTAPSKTDLAVRAFCKVKGGIWDKNLDKCVYDSGGGRIPIITPSPAPKPKGDCPRGRQYQAPLIGGCDPGYYREKKWGRDLCVCELGASAETSWSKLGDFFSGNLKMVLIVVVIAILGIVVIKVASKKVSIG